MSISWKQSIRSWWSRKASWLPPIRIAKRKCVSWNGNRKISISISDGHSPILRRSNRRKKILQTCKWAKNRGAPGTPILNLLQNLHGWFIIRLENRKILECPTVAQSETYKALSLLTDYRLSPIGVEDSLSVYLRLRLLSMYVKAANTTSKSVSTSKVFIPTSFLFPERTTARLSLLL